MIKKLLLAICFLLIPVIVEATITGCIFGQSNGGQMQCGYESLYNGCGSTSANTNVMMWKGSSWGTTGPTTGANGSEGLTALGNAINNATGQPVQLIDVAYGSSSIYKSTNEGVGWWWDDTTDTTAGCTINGITCTGNYTTQKAIITAATGGHCDFIVLMNGEGEGFRIYNSSCTICGTNPPSPNTWNQSWYITHYTAFLNQLRSDFGNVPIIQSQLATGTAYGNGTGFDSSWSNLREFNKAVIANFSHAYIGDATVNFTLASPSNAALHWTSAGYAQAGLEIAQTFLYDQGYVSWYKGPTITGLNAVDSTHTDILIQHSGGTDFTPTTGIGGFAETCGGSALTISAAARQTATSIRLTHGACSNTRVATYMYGVAPLTYGTGNAGTPVTDNSTLSYALEPNINITQIAGTTYTISGTISGAVQSGVTVACTGQTSTTTAGDGTYSFAGLSAGSYTVTPSKTGYTFSPFVLTPTISNADITGENFTSSGTNGACGTSNGQTFSSRFHGSDVVCSAASSTPKDDSPVTGSADALITT